MVRQKLVKKQNVRRNIQRQITAGPTLASQIREQLTQGRSLRTILEEKLRSRVQIPTVTPRAERAVIGPIMTTDPATLRDIKQRKARQAGWEAEAAEALTDKGIIPSSFIVGLEWIDSPTDFEHVILHVQIEQASGKTVWYSYKNVPRGVVMGFWAGNATCTTDAPGGFTGRKRKLWWVGKNPSLGAFFNQYIKHSYTAIRGRVYS